VVYQSIVFALALSQALANVDTTALTFPAEFKIDYVRVYQRQGAQNVGCDPSSGCRVKSRWSEADTGELS
jgi:beta-glucanase (GH16 family)